MNELMLALEAATSGILDLNAWPGWRWW